MMQPIKSSGTVATRRAWEAPVVTKLAIGTETKSAQENGPSVGPEPRPPTAPSSKLGFAFEMAFPLSVRIDG
jgi:hypothetical protein